MRKRGAWIDQGLAEVVGPALQTNGGQLRACGSTFALDHVARCAAASLVQGASLLCITRARAGRRPAKRPDIGDKLPLLIRRCAANTGHTAVGNPIAYERGQRFVILCARESRTIEVGTSASCSFKAMAVGA